MMAKSRSLLHKELMLLQIKPVTCIISDVCAAGANDVAANAAVMFCGKPQSDIIFASKAARSAISLGASRI
jgi:hypothetical protein